MRTELHCRQQRLGLAANRKVPKNDLQADNYVSQLNWCSWHPLIPLDAVRVRYMSKKLHWWDRGSRQSSRDRKGTEGPRFRKREQPCC